MTDEQAELEMHATLLREHERETVKRFLEWVDQQESPVSHLQLSEELAGHVDVYFAREQKGQT